MSINRGFRISVFTLTLATLLTLFFQFTVISRAEALWCHFNSVGAWVCEDSNACATMVCISFDPCFTSTCNSQTGACDETPKDCSGFDSADGCRIGVCNSDNGACQ